MSITNKNDNTQSNENKDNNNNNNNNNSINDHNDISSLKAQVSALSDMLFKYIQKDQIKQEQHSSSSSSFSSPTTPTLPSTAAPTSTPILTPSTSSTYKNTLKFIVLSDIHKLANNVNTNTFRTFKDQFILTVKLHGLDIYINHTYTEVCNNISLSNTHIPIHAIQAHVKQQSTSMSAAVQLALGTHWHAIQDKLIIFSKQNQTNETFISDNIYIIWKCILQHFESFSKYHKISWIRQLNQIKHISIDDPAKTLEKIQSINRLLIQSNIILPEAVLAAYLIDSMPSDMSSVQQHLCTTDADTIDDVYTAMKVYYDSKITKSNSINNNNKSLVNADIEKALTFKNTPCQQLSVYGNCPQGVECCFSHTEHALTIDNNTSRPCGYHLRGRCLKGDSCNYSHPPKSKFKSKSKSKSTVANNTTVDDDIITIGTFNDCIDYMNYDELEEATRDYLLAAQQNNNTLHLERPNEFILDSGASRNISCSKKLLTSVERINPVPMLGISSKIIYINQAGLMKLNSKIQLSNTLYLPNASTNLISVTKLLDADIDIKWSKTQAVLSHKGTTLITFKRIGGVFIYTLPTALTDIDNDSDDDSSTPGVIMNKTPTRKLIPRKPTVAFSPTTSNTLSASTVARNQLTAARGTLKTTSTVVQAKCIVELPTDFVQHSYATVTTDILHARFGHHGQHDNCETCILSKSRRVKIGSVSTRTPAIHTFDRLHMDLIGPISTMIDNTKVSVPTIGGHMYGLTIVDEKSRYVFLPLLTNKSETKSYIIKLVNTISTQFEHNVKQLHSDRGTEFINDTIKNFCIDKGMIQTTSTAYKPQHNGTAERMNGVICNSARAMLIHSKAPTILWGEALTAAVYIHNRTALSTLNNRSPYEVVYNQLPKTQHLRVWGCDAYIYAQPFKRGKFDSLSVCGIFVGYCEQQNGYRILLKDSTIRISRDIHFNENSFRQMVLYHTTVNTGTHTIDENVNIEFTSTSPVYESNVNLSEDMSVDLSGDSDNTIEFDSHDYNSNDPTVDLSESNVNLPDDTAVDLSDYPNDSEVEFDTSEEVKYDDTDINIDHDDSSNVNSHIITESNNSIESTDINTHHINNHEAIITAKDLHPPIIRTKSTRVSRRPLYYGMVDTQDMINIDNKQLDTMLLCEDLSMLSYSQAMRRSDADKFSTAMTSEINSLLGQNVGTEVTLSSVPTNITPITCRWVYTIKYDSNNQPIRHKARIVAHGYKQTHGIDYYETYAPVAKSKSMKLMLIDAAINNKEIKQLDVETAFLQAPLSEEVYIKLPLGCDQHSNRIWKLNKALYGLKQSPHVWNSEIHNTLTVQLGYTATATDPCIYIKHINNMVITLLLYVDDAVVTFDTVNQSIWKNDSNIIKSIYKIKDLGDCEWILNMKIVRDRVNNTITLSQQAYIQQVLSTHNYAPETTRTVDNPCDITSTTVVDTSALLNSHEHNIFRSIIGSLSYAANMTRIDIAYATSYLSRKVAAPTQHHLQSAKRILRYLAGTSHYCMIFKSHINTNIQTQQSTLLQSHAIVAYTDASHANELTDRKSTTGTLIKYLGNTICWQSKKQPVVALSSTEAEYYALSQTVCEALWVQQWVKAVHSVNQPILVLCDNQSAIHLSAHDAIHQRSKHIDIRYHFMRDHIKQQTIVVKWVSTVQQEADILTKCMITKQFQQLVARSLDSSTVATVGTSS
jgi:hypothetical protein